MDYSGSLSKTRSTSPPSPSTKATPLSSAISISLGPTTITPSLSSSTAIPAPVLFRPTTTIMAYSVQKSSCHPITHAGIVVAFYTSNVDVFEKNHDELDFEFLGNIRGKPWRFQTNLYGNGSTNRGREERYSLWFDPTKQFHRYTILWTSKSIIFYVDEVPIREVIRNSAMGGDYPSKPMSLYATIWDASTWATSGGKYKVNYDFQPFVAEFTDLVLEGCTVDPIQQIPAAAAPCDRKTAALEAADYNTISPEGRKAMSWFRERYMYYSYCYDLVRYPVPPPECVIVQAERHLFKDTGRLKEALRMKFGRHQKHRRRRGRRVPGGGATTL
ncbi:hypothetical protein Vadar_022308 [Vaccinium darrowii]|uniref:Uncharacterized protein n=1 Tax=Vaccinium darrowii TaxID=229202 RepID=A0ACB7ZFL1_9ERIC|nr:hypothetical protein Vadar_022308 [Vaccinium darrowii]